MDAEAKLKATVAAVANELFAASLRCERAIALAEHEWRAAFDAAEAKLDAAHREHNNTVVAAVARGE